MNPYRRAERIASIAGQVLVILAALVMIVTFMYYFVPFRWLCAVIVGFVLFMIVHDEIKLAWRRKREAWDEAHKEPTK